MEVSVKDLFTYQEINKRKALYTKWYNRGKNGFSPPSVFGSILLSTASYSIACYAWIVGLKASEIHIKDANV